MRSIAALARFFMQSFLKQKATTVIVLLTLLIITLAWAISDIDIGSSFKLFEDVLLTSQMFLLHLMAIFYAYEYGQKERLGGVFVLPIAMGISRKDYLLGVLLGQWSMTAMFCVVLIIIDAIALYLFEGSVTFLVLWQVVLFTLSAMLLSLLILMFSQFVSMMNSVIYSLTFFFLGNGLDELYMYAYYIKKDIFLQKVYTFFEYIIPNFSLYDKLGPIVNRAYESSEIYYVQPILYFLIVMTIALNISLWKFSKRALKVGQ